jgi:hypothetical protein
MRTKEQMGILAQLVQQNQQLKDFLQDFQGLVGV